MFHRASCSLLLALLCTAAVQAGAPARAQAGDAFVLSGPAPAPAPSRPPLHPGEAGDAERGVAFRLPAGLLAQRVERGFIITGSTPTAGIAVLFHALRSLEELRASARQGHTEPGLQLSLQGEPRAFQSNGLSVTLSGFSGGLPARAHLISLISPFGGGGVTVLLAAQTRQLSVEQVKLADAIAGSVRFFAPPAPSGSPLAREWQSRLSGARLTHLDRYGAGLGADGSYVGGTRETRIDLCRQGHFKLHGQSSASVSAGSVSGSSGGAQRGDGAWQVTAQAGAARLRLSFAGGRTAEHVLRQLDGKIYLDGTRYFLTRAGDGEHAPRCP